MVNDQISDMIVRIKNGYNSKKESLLIPYSNFIVSILEVLEKNSFIKSFTKKGKKVSKIIEVELIYENGKSKIQGIERVSHLSKRIYQKVGDIKPVKYGFGVSIISTSKGVMTNKDARKEKIGGEILFKIW